jgi:phosphopantetheinyl transferase
MKTIQDRTEQARLYAAQMRVRKQMGDRYAHAKRWHLSRPETRRLVSEQLENA